ncbi:spore germination protein [Effusibacillus pohliae]|uniref:spore germination protein n=1 Tax=Effusibacillus pohliae TaxID=232270 RepID=UPI0003777D21|nr:spore germination protein [Effusibacillus pohliae]
MSQFFKRRRNKPVGQTWLEVPVADLQGEPIRSDLLQNETILKQVFHNCSDVVFRPLHIHGQIKALLVFVDGLVDMKHLDEVVLKPMMFEGLPQGLGHLERMGKILEHQVVAVAQTQTVDRLSDVVQSILKGDIAILADGENSALIASIKTWEKRSIEEPPAESVIRGPREGFTENIRTNTSLLRRRLRTARLKLEALSLGELSKTDVIIAYIEGIAADSIVREVRKRVGRIRIDGVLESGYIEELIEDLPFSPFPQVLHTERPDVVAANLLEGKVAILVDTTPFVLIVPTFFWEALNANEDYYERFLIAAAIRWVRYIFLFVAMLFPSLYVAITTFHQEMLPTNLLLTIAASREPSPFPAFVEALIMEITFEALREAGLRLPRQVGQAISIVGALVIGQAAVQAGIVSAPMVIIVSITGIASFTMPRYNFAIAIRILRFPLIFLAGTLGLYGVTIGVLAILIHLTSLRSFGVPYFAPVAPLTVRNLKDVGVRAPWWRMNRRPSMTVFHNQMRVPRGQKPGPKRGKRTE